MANNTIGSMTAVVRATAGAFEADVRKIESSVSGLKNHFEASTPNGGIGSMLAGGALAGAGFAAFQASLGAARRGLQGFFDTMARADDLADFAAQIGSNITELSGLHFAAAQGGSSVEAMDAALQKMTQKIGEAGAGAKATELSFAALGLSADELANMSPGEALKTIADRFKDIPSAAEQADLAMDLFGKQGVNLVNVLKLGRAGIDELIASGVELGAVLDEEATQNLGILNDKIDAVKASWEGFNNTLMGGSVPALYAAAEGVQDTLKWLGESAKSIDENEARMAAYVVAVGAAIALTPALISAFGGIVNALRSMAKAQTILQALQGPGGIAKLAIGLAAAAAAGYAVDKAFDAIGDAEEAIAKKREEADATKEVAAALKKQAAEAKAVEEAEKRAHDALMQRGKSLEEAMRTPQEKFNASIMEGINLLREQAIGWETYSRSVHAAADALRKATDEKIKNDRFQMTPGVGAATRGSMEGFSAIQSATRLQNDIQKRQEELQKQELAIQRKQQEELILIRRALTQGRQAMVVSDIN